MSRPPSEAARAAAAAGEAHVPPRRAGRPRAARASLRLLGWLAPLLLLAVIVWSVADTFRAAKPAPRAAADAAAPGFPRSVPLADGTTLELAAPPRRIVPASSGLADLVCALAVPERIAALPAQVRDYSGLRDPGNPYLARPQFESYAAEPLLAFRPDLVITDRWSSVETTARLQEAGVVVLVMDGPEKLADVRTSLALLARVLGAEDAGRTALEGLQERVKALAASSPRRAGRTAVAYSNGGTGGWIAGAGTANDEWITLAGLHDAAAAAGRKGHERCSYEELLALDPDVIVVPGLLAGGKVGGTARLLASEPALQSLRALRTGSVVVLESWLYDTVSQHIVTAAERLAAAVDALPAPAR